MSTHPANRPNYFQFHNGEKATLPFSEAEYQNRLTGLQAYMQSRGIDVVVLSSMHNVAYYSGFLYCAFGRPYAAVVTASGVTAYSGESDQ